MLVPSLRDRAQAVADIAAAVGQAQVLAGPVLVVPYSERVTRQVQDANGVLREVAERAIEAVKIQAEQRGIAVNLRAAEAVPVRGDLNELEMILNNLVSNAVKYNRDGGKVDAHVGCN